MHSPLLSQLCKPGSQQALCHCTYTCGDLPFIHLCSEQALKNCSTVQGKMHSPLLSQLCNQAHSRHWVTAVTPVEICHSYRCAVSKHSKTAALFRANRIPHCSVLLLKTGSQQALCHCNYTCGDLPFIQVCSEQALKNCSTIQGKMHSHCSVSSATRLTAGSVSLQLHLEICHSYRCAVSKHPKTAALFRANCNPHCSVSS